MQSRGSCTVDPSLLEKQLLSFGTYDKRLDVVLNLLCLYFAHSCTKHTPQLLTSGSEATPHENHLYVIATVNQQNPLWQN